jgi:hypothetical protein
MSTVATRQVCDAYSERFDNLDEVAHPSLFYLPKFGELLQAAIDRGSPLTRAEVEAVFGDPGWEW